MNITLHSAGICNTQKDINQFMGAAICDHFDDDDDDGCEAKITTIGQVLCFGNIKFLDYCEKHIKTCNRCNTTNIKHIFNFGTINVTYLCDNCHNNGPDKVCTAP